MGNTIYRLNEQHFQEHIPGQSKVYVHLPANGGNRIRVDINSDGFRGPELLGDGLKPRLMVYGDSFTVAEYSELEASFPAMLAQGLGNEVEVVNAGVVGLGPDQISLRLRTELQQHSPDFVVLLVFSGNDHGDLIRNKIYQLDAQDHLVLRNARVSEDLAREFSRTGMAGFALGRLVKRASTSVPRRFFNQATEDRESPFGNSEDFYERLIRIAQLEFEAYNSEPTNVTNLFNDGYDADIALKPEAASAKYKRRLMFAVLSEIQRTVQRFNAEILIVSVPAPRDLIPNYDGLNIDVAKWPDYAPNRLADEVCSGLDPSICISLFDLFAARDSSALYFKGGNNHWNDLGQAVAAEYVTPHIAEALNLR